MVYLIYLPNFSIIYKQRTKPIANNHPGPQEKGADHLIPAFPYLLSPTQPYPLPISIPYLISSSNQTLQTIMPSQTFRHLQQGPPRGSPATSPAKPTWAAPVQAGAAAGASNHGSVLHPRHSSRAKKH